ncbi:MAG: GNAT family N-acetyltransferase [Candidatus Dormibacterales bacterium]
MTLHWMPVQVPSRAPLIGRTVRLEPVDPERHSGQLFASIEGADGVWDYLAYGPFARAEEFVSWLDERARSIDPLFYAVVDLASGAARGMASYMRFDPANGVIEIGHIWFAPALQRSRPATEAIFLMARHVFDDLGYRRLEWKCDSMNARSRRAALRFGFVYEGIFRQHMVIKDRNRDTAWFAMTADDWPHCRAAFTDWLADTNFDSSGHQKRSLAEIRGAATA